MPVVYIRFRRFGDPIIALSWTLYHRIGSSRNSREITHAQFLHTDKHGIYSISVIGILVKNPYTKREERKRVTKGMRFNIKPHQESDAYTARQQPSITKTDSLVKNLRANSTARTRIEIIIFNYYINRRKEN